MTTRRWRTYPHAVWCDAHGTHHGTENRDGDYIAAGCFVSASECGPDDWRTLAILSTEDEEW
jgi:hypothetical protein